MWNVMAECHHIQKRTLDEAKILLVDTNAKKQCATSLTDPQRLARFASNLETELRHCGQGVEMPSKKQQCLMA
ncbi:hypothetical protein VNO78_12246 [Psophocarpus tetragonolobus]|uniref:DUF632 domain-containing protein n=1 Tax=Psophocarpus tetragonolobus TaxID=3891 RepID=A0AAN9SPI8_PSOTE